MSGKTNFTDLKKKRLTSAVLAGLIFLVFILFFAVLYEVISVFTLKSRIDELNTEIEYYTTKLSESQTELESWEYEWKIKQRGRELGLILDNDDED